MLRTENLTVQYGNQVLALDQVTVSLEKGKMIGIIGPNGAGKSTFLKAIIGLVPHQGDVCLEEKTGKPILDSLAYVEQKSQLDTDFPLKVKECVAMGYYKKLGLFSGLKKSHWQKVEEVLKSMDLWQLRDRTIKELSGGQFQRMLIARCLLQEADYLLLDEPFAAIDLVSEDMIVKHLKALRDQGKTIVIVHHDLSKVTDYFDKLMLLNKGLVAYGEVEEVFTSEHLQKAYGQPYF